jgi:hypothetical protein
MTDKIVNTGFDFGGLMPLKVEGSMSIVCYQGESINNAIDKLIMAWAKQGKCPQFQLFKLSNTATQVISTRRSND